MTEPLGDLANISDKIEILSTDDLKIKVLGELLSNDSSRTILNLIASQEMTASEVANKTGMSLELARYHLQKMVDSGVVNISKVEKNTREQSMKYYHVTKIIVVVLPQKVSQKVKKSKSLFNSLSRIHRFMAIGATAIISWFISYSMIPDRTAELKLPRDIGFVPENVFWSVIVMMTVIISGLIIEQILQSKNNKTHNL